MYLAPEERGGARECMRQVSCSLGGSRERASAYRYWRKSRDRFLAFHLRQTDSPIDPTLPLPFNTISRLPRNSSLAARRSGPIEGERKRCSERTNERRSVGRSNAHRSIGRPKEEQPAAAAAILLGRWKSFCRRSRRDRQTERSNERTNGTG